MTSEHFSVRLKEAKLPTKNDIVHFIRKNYFDNEVTNTDKKVTSNKTRHVDVNKKLDDLAKEIKKYPREIYNFELRLLQNIGLIKIHSVGRIAMRSNKSTLTVQKTIAKLNLSMIQIIGQDTSLKILQEKLLVWYD